MADLIAIGYPDESTADGARTGLKTSLSKADEQELQEALHGQQAAAQ